jgi:hypothetical protein
LKEEKIINRKENAIVLKGIPNVNMVFRLGSGGGRILNMAINF